MKKKPAKSASTKTHYVRVMRPVFQRALVEVEAESEEEARRIATSRAEALPDEDWDESAVDSDPTVIIEGVAVQGEAELEGLDDPSDLLFKLDHTYMLLSANLETIEGDINPLNSLKCMTNLQLADIASDWVEQLDELRSEHVEEFLVSLKTQMGKHTSLRSLLEDLKKSRPDASEDDQEDEG